MARGKADSGAPPVPSSTSRPRRSSRSDADGKRGALRVAADGTASGNSIHSGAAAAALDGKQTERAIEVAAPTASDGKLGVSIYAAPTSLYPIDLGTYVAPSARGPEEAKFVENFYCALNFNLLGLHRFYASDAQLLWNFNGVRVNLNTAKEIKGYMFGASSKRKFHASEFNSLLIPQKNSVLLTVHGTTKSANNQLGTFVESFVLDLPGRLILDDFLVVSENAAAKASSPKKPQDHESKYHCGICNVIWHSTDTQEWVCCDWCDTWIHVNCDPTCTLDMKTLESSEYRYCCPTCNPKHEDVLTVKSSLKGKSAEPIIVSCLGMQAIYKPENHKIKCLCKICLKNKKMMSLNQWEKHTGCLSKNWRKSIKLKGTETRLAEFLDGIGGSSAETEIHQASSAEASQLQAAEASQLPAATSSLSYATSKNKHSQKSKVCILYDYDRMKSHQDKDNDHEYERAARIFESLNTLKEDGTLDRIEREAFDSADPEIVLGVHDLKQLKYVNDLPVSDEEHDAKFSLFSSEGTPEAIYSATGAAIRGVDLVGEGYYEKAFALIRPPGHHAGRNQAEGFCFFNNIAIAAKHLIDHHQKERILVVDFDVHHGNGTQEIFYDNKKVLFVSTHAKLSYPKSKLNVNDIGEGHGLGYNINVPLRKGFQDADLYYVFDEVILPVAYKFKPEIVLVSAGYDAGVEEKIAGCMISEKGFGTIVHKLLSLADGRMVLALEGGYNLTRLPICISHTIRTILGDEDAFLKDHDYRDDVSPSTISVVTNLKKILRLHWDVFKGISAGPSPEGQASSSEGGASGGGAPQS